MRQAGVDLDAEDIRNALVAVLGLRPPKFDEDTPPRAKIAALEDYLLRSAWAAAELEEALHWCNQLIAHFKAKIEQMAGYEVALPSKPAGRLSEADVLRAKRTVDPTSFEIGAEMRALKESLVRQIDRLRFEEQWVVSRAYSMISG